MIIQAFLNYPIWKKLLQKIVQFVKYEFPSKMKKVLNERIFQYSDKYLSISLFNLTRPKLSHPALSNDFVRRTNYDYCDSMKQ
jgi:hypothetical protein